MTDFIAKYWLEVLFGLIVSAFGLLYKRLAGKVKEQEAVKDGIMAILHDRIYQAYSVYSAQGFCPVEDMENIECMYLSYHELGGNGTGTELYSRIKSMPTQPPLD